MMFTKIVKKFCITIVFSFSWDDQLKWTENIGYAKFWRGQKDYYGIF